MCDWDSRARDNHWATTNWPTRHDLLPGSKNVLNNPLLEPCKVLLPPLHIKLGIMKQFVKALDTAGPRFQHLQQTFPLLSQEKVKEGIFDGQQIRKLMTDDFFTKTMNDVQREAWESFKDVTSKFLGNVKDPEYQTIVQRMLDWFKVLGCNMSLK